MARTYNELSIELARTLRMRRWPRGSDGAWRASGRSRTPCRALPPASTNSHLGGRFIGAWELVEDERSSDTPGTVMSGMETSELGEAIDRLPQRYRYVLVRRYGLDGKNPATLAELGDELELSRERIRQLQLKAVYMLKSGDRLCPPRRPQPRDERGLISMEPSRHESVFEGPQAEGVGRC